MTSVANRAMRSIGAMASAIILLTSGHVEGAPILTFNDALAFQSATASLTFTDEGFESDPPWTTGGPLTEPVEHLGVTWTAPFEPLVATTSIVRTGAQALATTGGGSATDDKIAALPSNTTAVGVYMTHTPGHAGTLTAFDSSGGTLGSVTSNISVSLTDFQFAGILSDEPIGSIRITSTAQDQIIDDFSFATSNVPEPSTLALCCILGAGGLLLGWRRKVRGNV